MQDHVVLAASWMLNTPVTARDADGNIVPDDGSWQARAVEGVYVFVEFLDSKGLLRPGFGTSRRPDLELRWSDLTDDGQQFTRLALDKWMSALDRRKSGSVDAKGLEKYWSKLSAR